MAHSSGTIKGLNTHINRYTKSIVASSGITRGHKPPAKKKRLYNKKSFRTIKKLTETINLFYENRKKRDHRFYWVTLTTVQHKSGLTDSELYYKLKLWLQHRGESYICIAERQRVTNDLHFHLIVERAKHYDIKQELKRLSKLFGVEAHPALFDVTCIHNIKTLVGYISKYVRKPLPSYDELCRRYAKAEQDRINKVAKPSRYKPPYSSMFTCRTFSYSGDIGKRYKNKSSTFRLSVHNQFLIKYRDQLIIKHKNDFFTVYEYSDKLWKLAYDYNIAFMKTFHENLVPIQEKLVCLQPDESPALFFGTLQNNPKNNKASQLAYN